MDFVSAEMQSNGFLLLPAMRSFINDVEGDVGNCCPGDLSKTVVEILDEDDGR